VKKILIVLLSVLLVGAIVMVGCPQPAPTTAPTTAPTAAPTGKPALGTPENPIKLRLAAWAPLEMPAPVNYDPYNYVLQEWIDTIEQRTGGGVQITPYWAESLVSADDTWEAVQSGIVDIGHIHCCAEPGTLKMTNFLCQIHELGTSSEVAAQVAWSLYDEGYFGHEWDNVKLIWLGINSRGAAVSNKKQIINLEDWKGQQLACVGGTTLDYIKAFGGTPVGVPVGDMYAALQRGTVDGLVLCAVAQSIFKWYEVTKYRTYLTVTDAGNGIGRDPCGPAMNLDTWNSLPPNIQAVFEEESGLKWSKRIGEVFDETEQNCLQFLADYDAKAGNPGYVSLTPEQCGQYYAPADSVVDNLIAELEAEGYPAQQAVERERELCQMFIAQSQ
jgi:TRAP-type C4-dicarboxylate transport system substrate-binding protein